MNRTTIPRLPELPGQVFDAEYRRAEIDHPAELEKMLPELETSAASLPFACGFFNGARVSVLDVGCGIGTLPYLLAQRNPNAQVVGVDISEDSIAHAREHYEPKAANLVYRVGSVESLSRMFADVDMITCVGAMHHFPDLGVAVDEIMRTLAGRGVFLLSDLNRENWHAFFSARELKYLDGLRRLPESVRDKKLQRQGYLKSDKLRRLLSLMSFQAAYTPAEVAAALGARYGFKGRMAGLDYLLAIYKL